jgi:hypothetical protein
MRIYRLLTQPTIDTGLAVAGFNCSSGVAVSPVVVR